MKTIDSPDGELKFWYTIHTSLDVVEEKTKRPESKDLYLGLLYLIEDYRIYGFITNTKIKILIIIETSNQQYQDPEIKIMFKKLHTCFISATCNPFYEIGTQIKSKKFEDLVKTLMLKSTISPISSSSNSPSNLQQTVSNKQQTEVI